MHGPPAQDVTALLLAWRDGDADALERLLPLVYEELHGLAHARMRDEWVGKTLQTTAIVHEVDDRFVDGPGDPWQNRPLWPLCALRKSAGELRP